MYMQSADWAVWAAWKLQTFKPQSPDNPLGHCREHSGAWVVSDLTSWTPPPHCSTGKSQQKAVARREK